MTQMAPRASTAAVTQPLANVENRIPTNTSIGPTTPIPSPGIGEENGPIGMADQSTDMHEAALCNTLLYNDFREQIQQGLVRSRGLLERLVEYDGVIAYPAEGRRPGGDGDAHTEPDGLGVLDLNLRMGYASNGIAVDALDDRAVTGLLVKQLQRVRQHLDVLGRRIGDRSSKVLVTGDLNAGKSTLCNRLIHRPGLLPTDQQPCTEVFCEILDARRNNGCEVAHAVPHGGPPYDPEDASTYVEMPLDQVGEAIVDAAAWSLIRLYVKDSRSIDQSILHNGVVDITLIDAPGLNTSTMQTTSIFSQQQEIDVIVFVVSAENHFTLSAKEFILSSAREKSHIFIVVNKFDNIRNQERCRRLISEQLSRLSPGTYDDLNELVHFVSSCEKEYESMFARMEAALRSFVLHNRAKSKLLPAKTYLVNLLHDIYRVCEASRTESSARQLKLRAQLDALEPELDRATRDRASISLEAQTISERTVAQVQAHTRRSLNEAIATLSHGVKAEYGGIFYAHQYAEMVKSEYLSRINSRIVTCEEYARSRTSAAVQTVQSIGLAKVKDFAVQPFRPQMMFSKRRARAQVDMQVSALDFVNTDQSERLGAASLSVSATLILAERYVSSVHSLVQGALRLLGMRSARRLLPFVGLALAGGVVAFFIVDVPNAVPRRLAARVEAELRENDFVQVQTMRISNEIRKVLRHPEDHLRSAFQRSVDSMESRRAELRKQLGECTKAEKFFRGLEKDASGEQRRVDDIALEHVK